MLTRAILCALLLPAVASAQQARSSASAFAVDDVAAGVGAAQLLEEMNLRGTWVAGVSYSVAQGLVTAAGSRIFASRR